MHEDTQGETAYTRNWTIHLATNGEQHLLHLADRPVRYLEIGVYEGRSATWMLENVLTHADSSMVGIDAWAWDDGTEDRARAHLERFGDKVELVRGDSAWALRNPRFQRESFDLIYIDGNHRAYPVLADSVLCWPLLALNGILVWDDYRWRKAPWKRSPAHHRPDKAIDAFTMSIRGQYEVLFRNAQLGIRKTGRPAGPF